MALALHCIFRHRISQALVFPPGLGIPAWWVEGLCAWASGGGIAAWGYALLPPQLCEGIEQNHSVIGVIDAHAFTPYM